MARVLSANAIVDLVQKGQMWHVETWERGACVHASPRIAHRLWWLDDKLLNWGSTLFSWWFSLMGYTFCDDMWARPYDVVIFVGYDAGRVARWLRKRGYARRLIMLLTDYMPLTGAWPVVAFRLVTNLLNERTAARCDEVWTLSGRIPSKRAYLMPLLIHQFPKGRRRRAVAYVGYPTDAHGLDLLFRLSAKHGFAVEVVGESAYLRKLRDRSGSLHLVRFHGLVTEPDRIHEIVAGCSAGWGIYHADAQPWLRNGVNGKLYTYLGNGIPPLTTHCSETSCLVEQAGVGVAVTDDPAEIERGLLSLLDGSPEIHAGIEDWVIRWNRAAERFLMERVCR